MGLLSGLFGKRGTTAIPESSVLAIGVAVTSRELGFTESDATGVYAHKNPSWPKRQPIRFFEEREHCQQPTTPEAMTAAMGRVIRSPFVRELGPCTVLVQERELTVPAASAERTARRGACVLLTFCRSSSDKKNIVMLHGAPIVFRNDLSEMRQA